MWYQVFPEEIQRGGFTLGFLTITPDEAYVGVVSTIISFPPVFIITFLFR